MFRPYYPRRSQISATERLYSMAALVTGEVMKKMFAETTSSYVYGARNLHSKRHIGTVANLAAEKKHLYLIHFPAQISLRAELHLF
jgi:hypothetical protein